MKEIPELKCDGCKARDEIIKRLAERIDKLEKEAKQRLRLVKSGQ